MFDFLLAKIEKLIHTPRTYMKYSSTSQVVFCQSAVHYLLKYIMTVLVSIQ